MGEAEPELVGVKDERERESATYLPLTSSTV